MELRIALRVADERDLRHLQTTLRLANQRQQRIRLTECPLPDADAVILRRGESGSAPLLKACEDGGRPVPVIYTPASHRVTGLWALRWPARTADLLALAEQLLAQPATTPDRIIPAGG